MENLLVGSIITIPTFAEGANLVLSTLDNNEKIYALLTPVEGNIDTQKAKIEDISINISKSIAISYNKKSGEMLYVTNKEIIKDLFDNIKIK